MTAATDKWVATARALAALHAIELNDLDDGEYVLTKGPYTQRVQTREAVAAVLRLAGIAVEDPPTEATS